MNARALDRPFAFVDLETTGLAPRRARVTDVAVVRIEPDGRASEWTSLVNPGQPVPPAIRALTGIDDAMLRDAPPFAAIADELRARLTGAIFVAHNAPFDYGFVQAEFARAGLRFAAPVLCTARLSRRLYPDREPHTLDAIAGRHRLLAALGDADRHRALGDARLIRAFLAHLRRDFEPQTLEAAIARQLVPASGNASSDVD